MSKKLKSIVITEIETVRAFNRAKGKIQQQHADKTVSDEKALKIVLKKYLGDKENGKPDSSSDKPGKPDGSTSGSETE